MKYIITCIILFCTTMNLHAQEQEQVQKILLDTIPFSALKENEDFLWISKVKNDESLNESVLERLAAYDITIVLGTWCSDSHVAVAQFANYLTHIGYDINKVTFIGLDEEKKSPTLLHEKLDITFVPTILFKHKSDEAHIPVRIVEYLPEHLGRHLLENL